MALSNWRVPWRLVALIVIPTVAGIVFAGLRVDVAAGDAATFGRVQQLAGLGQRVTALAQAMEEERATTASFIAMGRPAGGLAGLQRQYASTDALARQVTAGVSGIGPAFPAPTRAAAVAVAARITDLPDLRGFASAGQAQASIVVTDYSLALADLFTFDDDIAQEGGNTALIASVRALGSLSRLKDQASQQQAILATAFIAGQFAPGDLSALTTAQAQEAADLAAFQTSATFGGMQSFSNTVAGPQVDEAQSLESRAVVTGSAGGRLAPGAAGTWSADMGFTVAQMRVAERQLINSIAAQANALHQGAVRSAMLTGFAVLLLLLVVLLATVVIARSLMSPLQVLKASALEIAGERLPAEVRALTGAEEDPVVEPIGVYSTDEIGQVARAFDQVHREALRLAGEEARLRGSVSAMLVSLSRRSQSLLERLLRLIDTLELGEQDPERLASLFRMDHLATRMRRHSENLLVLAGHDPPRRSAAPVPLMDVTRAAISEIEQYERVTLDVQPGIAVIGAAVTDTVHLFAELLENATVFSAKTAPVTVAGRLHSSGGVLLTVSDAGMGMTEELLAQLNWRLENPPAADAAVSRHMGLFAVAHLAARHGIRVRLQRPTTGGLTAHVWLPGTLIARETTPVPWPAAPPVGAAAAQPLAIRGLRPSAPALAAPAVAPAAAPSPASVATGPIRAVLPGPVPRPEPRSEPRSAQPLPIFDAVESDWFRARGRKLPRPASSQSPSSPSAAPQSPSMPPAGLPPPTMPSPRPPARVPAGPPAAPAPAAAAAWSSPGDDGWRVAADAVLTPVSSGTTTAGLPRRTPQANLVPGSAGDREPRKARPTEPPEAARSRLAGFQRGSLRARAAVNAQDGET
jgi:signal transduction histidine kinase